MMRKTLTLLLLLTAHTVSAEVIVKPGAACSAILPAQSQQLEWRDVGLLNPTTDKDFFVLCPFERESFNSTGDAESLEFWSGALIISNLSDSTTPLTVTCQLKEFVGGKRVRANSESIVLDADSQGALIWRSRRVVDADLSSFNASCRLPPRTAASSIVSVSTAQVSNEYINRVQAAIEAES